MPERYLHVGGLVAMGFDPTGRYLLTVSHSGCGVFDTATWERVARDDRLAYPHNHIAIGIGPLDGEQISVSEIDRSETIQLDSPDNRYSLFYEEGMIAVTPIAPPQTI